MRTTGLRGRRGVSSDVPPEKPPSDVVPQLTGSLLPLAKSHQAVLAVLPEHPLEAVPCDTKELLPKRFSLPFTFSHGTSSPGGPDEGRIGQSLRRVIGTGPIRLEGSDPKRGSLEAGGSREATERETRQSRPTSEGSPPPGSAARASRWRAQASDAPGGARAHQSAVTYLHPQEVEHLRLIPGSLHLEELWEGGVVLEELFAHGGRDDDLAKKICEDPGSTDLQERRYRGGVAYDQQTYSPLVPFSRDLSVWMSASRSSTS